MRADAFRDKAFVKCGDGDSYYSGPFMVDNRMGLGCSFLSGGAVHDCQMAVQFEKPEKPNPVSVQFDGLQDGVYKWAVVFAASSIRERYRADGVWLPWGKPQNPRPPVIVAALQITTNGQWFGSDMRRMGLEVSLLGSNPITTLTHVLASVEEAQGALRPTQFKPFLESIKQPSCADMLAGTVPVKPLAPGHSLSDTYARTIEIVKENASKGIPDALTPHINPHPGREWLRPIPVCYSITHGVADPPGVNRKCDPTGEVVRVPGDLDVPSDFWESFDSRCKNIHMQGSGLEIKLKDSGHDDGRKRFISCTEIFLLGAVRKQLTDLGFGK